MEILSKLVRIIWIVALLVSVTTVFKIIQTSNFIGLAVKTNAKVEKILDANNGQKLHVLFLTQNRTYIRSSFNNTFIKGEPKAVEVLYNPVIPAENTLNDQVYIWYDVIVNLVIVSVCVIVAITIRLSLKFYHDRHKRFVRQGSLIYTTFAGIEKKPVNGTMAYRIVSKWRDPNTNKQHLFRSKFLGFDPADFILDNTISVIVNRNKKKYVMDISFLPKKKLQLHSLN